jgi:hypothetical protein
MRTAKRAAIAAGIFCTGIWLTSVETSAQSMPREVA